MARNLPVVSPMTTTTPTLTAFIIRMSAAQTQCWRHKTMTQHSWLKWLPQQPKLINNAHPFLDIILFICFFIYLQSTFSTHFLLSSSSVCLIPHNWEEEKKTSYHMDRFPACHRWRFHWAESGGDIPRSRCRVWLVSGSLVWGGPQMLAAAWWHHPQTSCRQFETWPRQNSSSVRAKRESCSHCSYRTGLRTQETRHRGCHHHHPREEITGNVPSISLSAF